MTTDTTPTADERPMSLRERSRNERFARILTAAEQLFTEKGFDRVTTKEVAQAAKVGEATLFRYVANKNDLLLLVVGRTQDGLLDELERVDDETARTAPETPPGQWYLDRIFEIYRARIRFYETDPENISKYVVTGLQSGSTLGPLSTKTGDRIILRVCSIIQAGQDAGVIRDNVEALLVARNVNGSYIHEVLRSPARNLPIPGTWDRLSERIDVMLRPLLVQEEGR